MGNAFGGSKGGSVDMTPDAFKGLQGGFADLLKGFFGGGIGGAFNQLPKWNGDYSAGITNPEQRTLDRIGGFDVGSQDYLRRVIGGEFLPGQAGSNPFLDAAIKNAQRPTLQGLTETLGRVLPGRFTAGGQFTQPQGSSAFDRAAAMATGQAAESLSGIATNMSFQGYESERNRQQSAVQLGQQELTSMTEQLKAQGLPRLIEEMGIERGMTEFNSRLQALMSALGLMANVTRPVMGNRQETDPNIFGSLFPKGLGPMPGLK